MTISDDGDDWLLKHRPAPVRPDATAVTPDWLAKHRQASAPQEPMTSARWQARADSIRHAADLVANTGGGQRQFKAVPTNREMLQGVAEGMHDVTRFVSPLANTIASVPELFHELADRKYGQAVATTAGAVLPHLPMHALAAMPLFGKGSEGESALAREGYDLAGSGAPRDPKEFNKLAKLRSRLLDIRDNGDHWSGQDEWNLRDINARMREQVAPVEAPPAALADSVVGRAVAPEIRWVTNKRFNPYGATDAERHYTTHGVSAHAPDGTQIGGAVVNPDGGVHNINVLPEYQKQGVANALLDRAEKELGRPTFAATGKTTDGEVLFAARDARRARSTPAALADSVVGRAARAAANSQTDAITSVFQPGMTEAEAMRLSERGKHLKQTADGQYVGGPRGIDSPGKLGAMRRAVDGRVERGLFNADWYTRARNAIASVSGFDPAVDAVASRQGVMAKQLANGGAAYSPQAMPQVETEAFLQQHNAKVIAGQDFRARTNSQMNNVANSYAPDPATGGYTISPEKIRLGNKTKPYGTAKDPSVPDESLYDTANDIWHGRVYGYRNPDGSVFNRGFAPQEHSFLTGENLLMAKRAETAGLRPPNAPDNFRWTPRAGQAATWGTAREEQKIAKEAVAMAQYQKKLTAWQKAKAKGETGLTKPSMPSQSSPEQIRAYASGGIDNALAPQTTHVIGEFAPGANTQYLSGFSDIPKEAQDKYFHEMLDAGGQRHPIFDALQMYSAPNQIARGEYTNSLGQVEHNLSATYQPLTGRTLRAPARSALDFAMNMDSALGAQEFVGANKFTPAGRMRAGEKTGLRVTGVEGALQSAQDALQNHGLDVVNVGDGLHAGLFGHAPDAVGPFPDGRWIQQRAEAAMRSLPEGHGLLATKGNWETMLEGAPWGERTPGDGTIAKFIDGQLSRPDIVNPAQRLDAAGVPSVVARRKAVSDKLASEFGLKNPDDIQRLLDLIGGKGFSGFQRHVREHGYGGLAGIAGITLGAGLLAPRDPAPKP